MNRKNHIVPLLPWLIIAACIALILIGMLA